MLGRSYELANMSWAKRLKRMLGIEIESGDAGGGKGRAIANVEDPVVIGKILQRLVSRVSPVGSRRLRT